MEELEIGKFLGEFLVAGNTKGFLFVVVKVAGISGALALWDEWCIQLEKKVGNCGKTFQ